MNRNSSVAMLMSAMLAGQSMAMAQSAPVELKWEELSSILRGHDIELVLPEGTFLKGEVEVVREDALVLNVKHTSDSRAHPKGNAVIPRASLRLLSLKESRAKWGRTFGVTLGTLAGVTLGAYTATQTRSDAAGLATFLGVAGAGPVAGYFIGKSADHRVKHIRVIP